MCIFDKILCNKYENKKINEIFLNMCLLNLYIIINLIKFIVYICIYK